MTGPSNAAWRRQLSRASFRGVPFFVASADTEEGRRGVLHEYPLREAPFVEDLGRKAGEFGLEAIIVGADYFKARDALREALKKPGPGELVHPTLGRMQVALTAPFRFVEALVEGGGMARFSLRFTETAENTQPAAAINTPALVETAAAAAATAAADEFAAAFGVAGAPAFVTEDAAALLAEAAAAIAAARAGVMQDLTVTGELTGALSGFGASASSLILTPATLAGQLLGLAAGLRGAVLRPRAAFDALARLFVYRSARPAPPLATPARRAQAANRAALEALVRRAAVIEAARAVARIDFAAERIPYQQAAALRERLAEALEDEAAGARIEAFGALMDLRAAVVRDITARGAILPRLATISLPATLPALVAAYRAFGDARREAEIVARNPGIVRHPGFVPGGLALEVLA